MNSLNILTIISNIYNSLNNTSLFSMLPFLILFKYDSSICRFKQYAGNFYSLAFNIENLQFKEITILTPFRYFLNKKIFKNIDDILATGEYSVYLSFLTPLKVNITLYNNQRLHIINYKIKLFSFMFNGNKIIDFFIYHFKLNKLEKLQFKQEQAEKRNKELLLQLNIPVSIDAKQAARETKKLINSIKKKYKEEQKKQKDFQSEEVLNKQFNEELRLFNETQEKMKMPDYDSLKRK